MSEAKVGEWVGLRWVFGAKVGTKEDERVGLRRVSEWSLGG